MRSSDLRERDRDRDRGQGTASEKVGAHCTGPGQGLPDFGLPSPCPGLQVYRQELLKQYHKELQEWKDEKARQEVEFTITDRKVKVSRAEWARNTTELSSWPCQRGQRW